MKKSNEDYSRAILIGEEPGTGVETGSVARKEKKKRALGRSVLRRKRNDPTNRPEETRQKREREIRDLHSRAFGKLQGQLQALDYLSSNGIYSYSKSLPRRSENMMRRGEGFDGSYDELAEATLDQELSDRKSEDDSFDLLSADKFMQRLQELEAGTPSQVGLTPERASDVMKRDLRYHGGVPVLLWKLGLMEFDDEQSFLYGKGEQFSANANWGDRGPNSHYAKELTVSLPYDDENILHRKIADATGQPITSLEFTVHKSQGGSYGHNTGLSMQVLSAVEQQEAKAA